MTLVMISALFLAPVFAFKPQLTNVMFRHRRSRLSVFQGDGAECPLVPEPERSDVVDIATLALG